MPEDRSRPRHTEGEIVIPETLERAPQRLKVYEFIKAEVKAGRPFPDNEAIRSHMGWKGKGSVSEVLRYLAQLDHVLNMHDAGGTWRRPKHTFSLKAGL